MRSPTVDAMAYRAAARISRRRSLLTLGGAGFAAALATPLVTSDRKSGKKRNAKKAFKRCKPQVAQCAAAIQTLCDELETDPEVCAAVIDCCEFFGKCRADKFLTCEVAA